jgi:heme-binding protein
MLAWLKRLAVLLVFILVAIQFFQPPRTNPSIDPKRELSANRPVDAAVGAVLERSCNDCHSYRSVWPWYSHVAPVSWLVVSDVNRGRKALNFSEWAGYPPEVQQKQLSEICKEVSEGEMPGLPYTLLHPRAKVSTTDVTAICSWTRAAAQNILATTGME